MPETPMTAIHNSLLLWRSGTVAVHALTARRICRNGEQRQYRTSMGLQRKRYDASVMILGNRQ